MNALLDTTLQAVGLKALSPTRLDVKLLTDDLGRSLPTFAVSNNGTVQWLGSEGNDLTRNGYTNHGTAYSIIKYILDTAKPLPWGVYELVKDEPKKLATHALYDLLYRPNPRQSWAELKEQAEGYLLTCGNAYLYGVRPAFGSKRGKVGEVWCLPSPLVEVMGGGWMQEVESYRIRNTNGTYTAYAAADVLHLKFWNPDDSRYGLSPIAAGIDSVTAAKAGLTSRVKQYQNQGPPGIIFSKGENQDPWTAEQAGRVQGWFGSFFSGRRREGQVPIVSKEMGYVPLGLSPVDLAVLEAIPLDKDAVADLFHFPGQLLNGSKGTTFSNMGEAGKALYNRCVLPLESQLRDGLNRWLGADYGDKVYIDFDTSGVAELQEDLGKLATWLATAWWVSVPEKRKMLGLDPTTWKGPDFMVPQVLSDPLAEPEPALGDTVPAAGDVLN